MFWRVALEFTAVLLHTRIKLCLPGTHFALLNSFSEFRSVRDGNRNTWIFQHMALKELLRYCSPVQVRWSTAHLQWMKMVLFTFSSYSSPLFSALKSCPLFLQFWCCLELLCAYVVHEPRGKLVSLCQISFLPQSKFN